jgi:hypothetical protein
MPPFPAITELSDSDREASPVDNPRPSNPNVSPNATVSGSSQPSSPHRGLPILNTVSLDASSEPENLLARLGGIHDPDPDETSTTRHSLLERLNERTFGPSITSRKRRREASDSPSPRPITHPMPPSFNATRDEELSTLLDIPLPDASVQANGSSPVQVEAAASSSNQDNQPQSTAQPLSNYACPICFSPPTRACLTSCGHVMCGPCLFSAVKTAKERHVRIHGSGAGPDGEGKKYRCPVCRAEMKKWDGKGGGVIGLKLKLEKPAT